MFGLRHKLLLGFGGMLLILLGVSGLGIAVLRQHENALARFQYDNWRSIVYGQNMIDAVDRLDSAASSISAENRAASADAIATAKDALRTFDENLQAEKNNITLPGEDRLAANLAALWSGVDAKSAQQAATADCYRTAYQSLLEENGSLDAHHAAQLTIERLSPLLRHAARQIVNINLQNMTPIEGQIKSLSDKAERAMIALAILGIALAIALTALVSRSILRPLSTLTRSCREIEQNNLDLVVQVKSRDELYQLAEAFNSMAAKLREFRRTDRAKLVRTQRTTQLAVDSMPDAIAIISPDGAVELSNETARRLFQLNPGRLSPEVHGRRLVELFKEVSREARPSQPRGYESALEVYDQGGQLRFFLPHAIPIIDVDQHLLGVTLILGDVTNLRRLDEMKSGLLSVVSHELKTPLTSIRMAVHLLLQERVGPLTSKQTELLIAARDESNRLQTIIEDLLDMGRLESGTVALDLQSEPADRLVSDAISPLETAYHDRGIGLHVAMPADTPQVLADPARIGHVFSNLLTNALRFTPPGGHVKIAAETTPDFVRFIVTDTGIGIPQQYLARVFERFFRVPRDNQPAGAGLGLAIAREIVEAHGGTIAVESRENAGSAFSFTLKRADRTLAPPETEAASAQIP